MDEFENTLTLDTDDLVLLAAVNYHNEAFKEQSEEIVWKDLVSSLMSDKEESVLEEDKRRQIEQRFYDLLMVYNKISRSRECGEDEAALKVLFEKLDLEPFIKRILEAEGDLVIDEAARKSLSYRTFCFRRDFNFYNRITDRDLEKDQQSGRPNRAAQKVFRIRTICGIANSLYLSRIPIKSDKALKMMEKMGYKRGKGLGKDESGSLKPIPLPDHIVGK